MRKFSHILIATDGSPRSRKAIATGVMLAKALGARVRAVYVATLDEALLSGAAALHGGDVLVEHHDQANRDEAKKVLAAVARAAKAAGVRYGEEMVEGGAPWKGILSVARRRKCDAIVMASHGRGPLAGLLRGSQTAEVLSRAKMPVIVVR